jgi:hypothetical protein
MRLTTGRNGVLIGIVLMLCLLGVPNAQEHPRTDASWTAGFFARSIQLDWLAEDRARVTLAGDHDERFTIKAAAITLSTTADGLSVSAHGRATMSVTSQPSIPAVESIELTITRDGSAWASFRR